MPKKANLDLGFLLLYDWLPAVYELPAKEVKALLIALIERQRENKPLPIFKNRMTNSFALMIEPVIQRRLDGQAGGKKGHERGEAPTLPPCPPREEENERMGAQDNVSLFERRKEEILRALPLTGAAQREREDAVLPPSSQREREDAVLPPSSQREREDAVLPPSAAPDGNRDEPDAPPHLCSSLGTAEKEKGEQAAQAGDDRAQSTFSLHAARELPYIAPLPCAQNMLSDAERSALLEQGVRSAYINERIARAAEWAERTKKSVYSVLLEWWQKDKHDVRYRNLSPSPPSESSFDADEVFAMMVARTYQNENKSDGSPTNV